MKTLAFIIVSTLTSAAWAEQGRLPETTRDFTQLARKIEDAIGDKHYSEAVKAIQDAFIERTVVVLPEISSSSRSIGLGLLQKLPKDGLETYERLYGPIAKKELAKAVESDIRKAGEVAARWPYTQAGIEALKLEMIVMMDLGNPRRAALAFRELEERASTMGPTALDVGSIARGAMIYKAVGDELSLSRIMQNLKAKMAEGEPLVLRGKPGTVAMFEEELKLVKASDTPWLAQTVVEASGNKLDDENQIGRLVRCTKVDEAKTYQLGFSSPGLLRMLGKDGKLVQWDLIDNTRKESKIPVEPQSSFRLSPDGKHVFTRNKKTFEVFEAATGKQILSIPTPGMLRFEFLTSTVSPDQKKVAWFDGSRLKVWSVEKNELESEVDVEDIRGLSFSGDGKWIQATSGEQMNPLASVRKFKINPVQEIPGHVQRGKDGWPYLARELAGKFALIAKSSGDRWFAVVDANTGKTVGKPMELPLSRRTEFGQSETAEPQFVLSPTGKQIAYYDPLAQKLALKDVETGNSTPLALYAEQINGLTFSPDGNFYAGVDPANKQVCVHQATSLAENNALGPSGAAAPQAQGSH